jgi:hypothetical protein
MHEAYPMDYIKSNAFTFNTDQLGTRFHYWSGLTQSSLSESPLPIPGVYPEYETD